MAGEMIERVDKAIRLARATGQSEAVAAVKAMRGATSEMIDAAWSDAQAENPAGVWDAMIDAALRR